MDLLEALYTTRSMRRVRPDPVPTEVVAAMLDAAVRAPSGGNAQNWRFVVVTEESIRRRLGEIYRKAYATLQETVYDRARVRAEETGDEQALRVFRSSDWLAENFERVPLWLLVFSRNDPTGASVYPAVWSAMLAARAHGVGTCLTTVMGMFNHSEVLEEVGVPADKGWSLAAAVSAGFPRGQWGVPRRAPVEGVSYADRWGRPLGISIDGPLWEPAEQSEPGRRSGLRPG